jgi:transposase InsO family protein
MRPNYERRKQAYARLRFLKVAGRSGNIAHACRLWNWTRKTYYKWKNRYDGTLDSLMDRSRRPHRHPRQLSEQDHQLVLRVARKHKRAGLYRLHFLLCAYHGFTRSVGAVYKALRRLGFYAPRKLRRRRKYQRYERPWPGANIQIDVKYLPQIRQRQEYQFTAIDEYSRLRLVDITDELSPRKAKAFLTDALDFFQRHQVRVQQVQTDHGSEFTYAMFPHVQAEHPFERELRKEGIIHKLTPIGKPHLQGKVERSHRIDDDEFHTYRFFRTSAARARAFKAYINYYNHQRPHGSLNWRTPAKCLDDYLQNQSVTYD